MTAQEKFLSLYKEYEGLLRAAGKEPREAEEESSGLDSDRLRICRQIRNYISHVDDAGFVGISDKMLGFMQGKVKKLREEGDVAKKHLKKPEICILKENEKCSDAIQKYKKLKKTELVLICEDGSYWKVSIYEILGAKETQKVSSLKKTKVKPDFCCPLDYYGNLSDDSFVLCTEDGTPSGKLLGQVWFS